MESDDTKGAYSQIDSTRSSIDETSALLAGYADINVETLQVTGAMMLEPYIHFPADTRESHESEEGRRFHVHALTVSGQLEFERSVRIGGTCVCAWTGNDNLPCIDTCTAAAHYIEVLEGGNLVLDTIGHGCSPNNPENSVDSLTCLDNGLFGRSVGTVDFGAERARSGLWTGAESEVYSRVVSDNVWVSGNMHLGRSRLDVDRVGVRLAGTATADLVPNRFNHI